MERIGVYKARTIKQGEKVLHAPEDTDGEFVLYRDVHGNLKYMKVLT